MGITKDTLVRGHTFDGATGMKTGADLEDLVTRATLAAGTELLDGVTLEAFLDVVLGVYRARVKDGSIASAKLAAGAVTAEKLAAGAVTAEKLAAGAAIPAGAVMAFAMETAPTGWLECDGASLERAGTYAGLFAAIGTAHGAVDSTHFNIPDLRGQFVRGWNHAAGTDPGASARTAGATGGVTGDRVGTKQADEIKAHTHAIALHTSTDDGGKTCDGSGTNTATSATGSTGGLETRPKNIALMYCIKT